MTDEELLSALEEVPASQGPRVREESMTVAEAERLGHRHRVDEPPLPYFVDCGCASPIFVIDHPPLAELDLDSAPSWQRPAWELCVPESD